MQPKAQQGETEQEGAQRPVRSHQNPERSQQQSEQFQQYQQPSDRAQRPFRTQQNHEQSQQHPEQSQQRLLRSQLSVTPNRRNQTAAKNKNMFLMRALQTSMINDTEKQYIGKKSVVCVHCNAKCFPKQRMNCCKNGDLTPILMPKLIKFQNISVVQRSVQQ